MKQFLWIQRIKATNVFYKYSWILCPFPTKPELYLKTCLYSYIIIPAFVLNIEIFIFQSKLLFLYHQILWWPPWPGHAKIFVSCMSQHHILATTAIISCTDTNIFYNLCSNLGVDIFITKRSSFKTIISS